MKLYKVKIPAIAREIVETLANEGAIEVAMENRAEAEMDLVAIMEEYLRRDNEVREAVREHMAQLSVPYDQYGKVRTQVAERFGHPTGDEVQRYLARQFIENFMISRFVDEVYAEDKDLIKRAREIVERHDVDERALRTEAQEQIRNVAEGTMDYEIAMSKAMRDVKKRHGLLQ